MLTTHLCLVPTLGMTGAVLLLPPHAFMSRASTTLPSVLSYQIFCDEIWGFTAVLLNIRVFWVVIPCLFCVVPTFRRMCQSSTTILPSFGDYSPNHTASHPWRLECDELCSCRFVMTFSFYETKFKTSSIYGEKRMSLCNKTDSVRVK
jgi:hypothetical protein